MAAASLILPTFNELIAILNPSPLVPRMFWIGTLVSLKKTCLVEEEFRPNLISSSPKVKPLTLDFSNIKFNQGHYYFSGFAEKNYKIIYFSISDVRHFPNDNSVLIRTAKHTKDWTGGSNNYAKRNKESIKEIANKLIK